MKNPHKQLKRLGALLLAAVFVFSIVIVPSVLIASAEPFTVATAGLAFLSFLGAFIFAEQVAFWLADGIEGAIDTIKELWNAAWAADAEIMIITYRAISGGGMVETNRDAFVFDFFVRANPNYHGFQGEHGQELLRATTIVCGILNNMRKGDYVVVADGEVWSIDYNSYMKLREQSVQFAHMLGSDVLFVGEVDNINAIVSGGVDVPGLTETAEGWTFQTNRGSISIDGHIYETLSTLRMSDLMEITYREWVTENHDTVIDGRTVNFRGRVNIIPYFLHNNDVYISSSMTIAQLGAPYTVSNVFMQRTGFTVIFQGNSNIMRFQTNSNTARDLITASRGSYGSQIGIIRHYTFGDTLSISRENWTSGGFSGSFVLSGDISFYSRHPGTGVIGEHSRIREIYGITDSFLNLSNGELINLNNETHISKQEKEKLELKFIVANHNPAVGYFEHLMRVMTPDRVITDHGNDKVIVPPAPFPWWREVIDRGMDAGLISRNPTIAIDADRTMTVDGLTPEELARQLNIPIIPPITLPNVNELPLVISKFPFSLPWDLYEILTILIVPAKDPVFVFPLKTEGVVGGVDLSIDEEFVLDLTRFRIGGVDMVREIIRFVFIIGFVFMLIKVTPKLLK
jgi:hypothetical protein